MAPLFSQAYCVVFAILLQIESIDCASLCSAIRNIIVEDSQACQALLASLSHMIRDSKLKHERFASLQTRIRNLIVAFRNSVITEKVLESLRRWQLSPCQAEAQPVAV